MFWTPPDISAVDPLFGFSVVDFGTGVVAVIVVKGDELSASCGDCYSLLLARSPYFT
jgi:hypothetical protein